MTDASAREAGDPLSALAGEFVDIPGGTFQMGCSPGDSECRQNEHPVHTVSIKPFRMGKYEVTVGQFRQFVEAAGYRTDAERGGNCWAVQANGHWAKQAGRDWRNPGFPQTERHPVCCVSWNDAEAYTQWLSRQGAGRYRLPSESEWEYAARAGGRGRYSFGDSEGMLCQYGNVGDRTAQQRFNNWTVASCDDGTLYTAPVGGYRPNRFGLHDMHGNVWEWTEDCYHDSYAGAPSDGDAWTWTASDCAQRVFRGGSWGYLPGNVRSSGHRFGDATGDRGDALGFRLLQDRPPAATATSPVPTPFAPISGSEPTEALPTPPTEVADIPDLRVGDTYLVDSQYPNNAKLNNMTERKVVSVIDGGVTVASQNVKSRSGQSRMLRYTQEWNLVSSRNADGSGLDYLPPLKYFEFPLYPGKGWRQTSRETNVKTGATRDFTLSATVGEWENISVPAGTFRAIKITTRSEIVDSVSGQRSTGTDVSWYAPDIRRSVKSVITSRNMQGDVEDQFIHVAQYQVNR